VELKFRSKKDAWLGAVLWIAVAGALAAAATAVLGAGPMPARLALGLAFVAVPVLVLWVWYGTNYRLGDRELRIRSGPFRFRVELATIREVRPSRNPLSGPALSLDRLFLRTGEGSFAGILVSPEPREAFLAALAERAGLLREGERWVRPARRHPA
jgi:hypothetical protein